MLECTDISKAFGRVEVLRGVSLKIRPGEFHVISGPSGCGKSTLLRILALLEASDAGHIRLSSEEFRHIDVKSSKAWSKNLSYRSSVTMVFQQLFMWPHITLGENLSLVAHDMASAERLCEELGIDALLSRYPNEVSLGQRQRAAFVRAISTNPDYLFLDEVTSALDQEVSKTVIKLVEEYVSTGRAVVMVTHAPGLISNVPVKFHTMLDGVLS